MLIIIIIVKDKTLRIKKNLFENIIYYILEK